MWQPFGAAEFKMGLDVNRSRKRPSKQRAKRGHKKRVPRRPVWSEADESRPAVAMTVAWLLCGLTTTGALAITLLVQVARSFDATVDTGSLYVSAFRFVAVMTGLLTLLLTVVTLRIRHRPPPRSHHLGGRDGRCHAIPARPDRLLMGLAPLSPWRPPRGGGFAPAWCRAQAWAGSPLQFRGRWCLPNRKIPEKSAGTAVSRLVNPAASGIPNNVELNR